MYQLLLALFIALPLATVSQYVKLPTAQQSLDRMLKLREEHGNVIHASTEIFQKYIKSKHSKYSVVAMFTALKPSMRCEVCPSASKQFSILASSYEPSSFDKPIFFVLIDYQKSAEAFHMMKLEHVPGFYYFPGDRKRRKSDAFSGRKAGYGAMAYSRWLADVDNIKIRIVIPFDYSKLVLPGLITLLLGLLTYLKPALMSEVLGNKVLWGITVLCTVLLMTSGQMWNHIRKPAEAGRDGNGLRYVQGGRGGQYIFESYIVMSVNLAIALGFILMNEVHSFKQGLVKRGEYFEPGVFVFMVLYASFRWYGIPGGT